MSTESRQGTDAYLEGGAILQNLQELWPEGDMYAQEGESFSRGKPVVRFHRWLYIIPRFTYDPAEYTKAATFTKADDGRNLGVAWYEGNPQDIGCTIKEKARTVLDLLKEKT